MMFLLGVFLEKEVALCLYTFCVYMYVRLLHGQRIF